MLCLLLNYCLGERFLWFLNDIIELMTASWSAIISEISVQFKNGNLNNDLVSPGGYERITTDF